MNTTKKNPYLLPFILITSLFFLWGIAHKFNPILVPHLRKACELTNFQSAFIDSAFFLAYFLMAIPASLIMGRIGYKGGILIGLLLFATGAFLFYPAANVRSFEFFLLAQFVIACGLTFLETAANPYVNELGDPATATQRLNFAQSFNGLAQTIAPKLGGLFILTGVHLTATDKAHMTPEQWDAYLNKEASTVQIPYLIIGGVVLLVALLLSMIKLPEINEAADADLEVKGSIFKEKNLMFSVLAQFCYVGAEVGIASFFIKYAEETNGIGEKDAANLLSIALIGFVGGRFIGTFLMKYIKPHLLLAVYGVANIVLLIVAFTVGGKPGLYALMATQFFMSIMFPTIFSLGIRGLGTKRKRGASFIIMAIVGGAVVPTIMAKVADVKSFQLCYSVPIVCFVVILFFAISQFKIKAVDEGEVQVAH
ncbi:MFS transporter, FHS family, L-fucose permease [Filimonas lacunae]|uniref:MFS transporter, FHS family, L-fucose permease n=1 Tax=Filimonas lacunae TaxID=477680 RepID=A0A173MAE6_9BACT|nr:L-fucose:H+ symporter permease [Filimonas lacunae]BAV04507.1 fucose permease [Filimonas lacunae]SIT31621.1 MFS transporter, FHS family, L-fucose permease [Filimonas lacunae]